MRAYVATTGALFGLLVTVHLWRALDIEPNLTRDPWFLLVTLASGALCVWAFILLRRPRS